MLKTLLPQFIPYQERYQSLPMQALSIEVELLSPIIYYTPLHFDAIIQSAIANEALNGDLSIFHPHYYYEIPLPFKKLWTTPSFNLPLWATTDLIPNAPTKDIAYFHRRALEPTMTKRNIDTGTGAHKEKRTPLPTSSATHFSCTAIGNPEEISRLLATVTAIGKKNSTHGAVCLWRVSPIEQFSLVNHDNRALRPIPIQYLYPDILPDAAQLEAFTPPYWSGLTRDYCITHGQKLPLTANPSKVIMQA